MISLGINIHQKNPTLTAKVGRIMKEVTGAWYDPLLPYLYTTLTGVTAVAAAENPIGLMIDRGLGVGLGSEMISNVGPYTVTTGYTARAGCTIAATGGNLVGTSTGVGAMRFYYQMTTVVGKSYRINSTIAAVTGTSPGIYVYSDAGITLITSVMTPTSGTYSFQFIATTTSSYIEFGNNANTGAGQTYSVSSLSSKLLDGNHSIQATAAARPTYRIDAGGLPYIAALGTDDNMTCATGGGGTTGFYLGCAIVVAGGAGTAREIYSDSGANTGIHVEIDAANKLSMSAGNGVAFTTLASTATVDVGTKYILEAYITGGVMYLQINGAAAESVAAPTITAGSSGFTLFKDNLLASDFMIGNIYSVIYAKNTGLTESQRGINRSYLRSRIGL